jgi:homogentisate 1,2-dioxygenase
MQAHGPDAGAFQAASEAKLKPEYQANTLAFMFESCLVYHPTKHAVELPARQKNYLNCWSELKPLFK